MKKVSDKKEVWVKTYCSPFYEVSNFGQVRSIDRKTPTSRRGTQFIKGKTLKPLYSKGYAFFHLRDENHKIKDVKLHQLVYHSFNGTCPVKGMNVSHIDKDVLNNRLINLEFITDSDKTIKSKIHVDRKGNMPLYIQKKKNCYGLKKRIDGKYVYFGHFGSLDEAISRRDELIKCNWKV